MDDFDARKALMRASRDPLALDIVARAGFSGNSRDWGAVDQDTRTSVIDVVLPFLEADHNEQLAKHGATSLTDAFYRWSGGIRIDSANDKAHLIDLAARYNSTHSLHSPSFTHVVLKGLLDTELCPLQREIEDPSQLIASQLSTLSPAHASAFLLRGVWSKITWTFSAVLLTTAALVANSHPLAAVCASAIAVILIVSDLWKRFRMRRAFRDTKVSLHALFNQLRIIRNEVDSGAYDPSIIVERLQAFEVRGGYVPSVAYGLLQLHR